MDDWKKTLISPDASLREAIRAINSSGEQIALVVDERQHLLGTLTDGDIRSAILKNVDLDSPVRNAMNPHPTVAQINDARDSILAVMKSRRIHQIPVVDASGAVAGMETLDEIIQPPNKSNSVVIMAGGLGSRLLPLTNDVPKPMLTVGTKPILETILGNFIEHGFSRFYLSVNYKAEVIQDYFGDGSKWGVKIDYLKENISLGTAGSLSLLPQPPAAPLLVMNGDVLTKVNFDHLLNFHLRHKGCATMCVRQHEIQVPYGVVSLDQFRIRSIDEKPVHKFFVNAGIYVLEPEALAMIPAQSRFDMPELFQRLIDGGRETAVFPIMEYWADIGHMSDFLKAGSDFDQHF